MKEGRDPPPLPGTAPGPGPHGFSEEPAERAGGVTLASAVNLLGAGEAGWQLRGCVRGDSAAVKLAALLPMGASGPQELPPPWGRGG